MHQLCNRISHDIWLPVSWWKLVGCLVIIIFIGFSWTRGFDILFIVSLYWLCWNMLCCIHLNELRCPWTLSFYQIMHFYISLSAETQGIPKLWLSIINLSYSNLDFPPISYRDPLPVPVWWFLPNCLDFLTCTHSL